MSVQPKSFTTLPKGYVTTRQVAKRFGIHQWEVEIILQQSRWIEDGRPADWAYEQEIAVHIQRSVLENHTVLWDKVRVPQLVERELARAGRR